MVRWGVAAAGLLALIVLAGGLLYEYVIKPNQTLATVGSVSISRQDYWRSRAINLYEQALQYQDFAQFVGPDQQGQYLALAEQSLAELPTVWGSTDVDPASLEKMIDDQVYLQGMDDLGIDLSQNEIRTFALNRFAPPGAPLIAPSPTATLTAERAVMATGTAAALFATPLASPVVASPISGTPTAGTPVASTPSLATPVPGTPVATPLAIAPTAPAATPNPAEARATAEAGFAQFADQVFPLAHLSQEDYERLVAAPALARQKVGDALAATVGQSAPQVRAAHILLPVREEAEAARARVTEGGEDFATVARELSTDDASAANGGELGWFTREEMVAPFAEATFALEPGAISEPVETEFGWHVIQVLERDPERPLTDLQINRLQQTAEERWLAEQRAGLGMTSTLPPTPTPFAPDFVPPVGAPPLPAPTSLPLPATPVAAPGQIPIVGTPSG
ncbi:MAG: PpiC-type peptidyl-prolyl cis-trans isomerase [Thermomicrobiales bacterium]|nr:PpiC-type peptidyl-prolyl cis-trans isomerase [Thermomicrobiales bacterium]